MPSLLPLLALWLCWGTSFPAIRVMVATLPPLLASGAVFCLAGGILAATRPKGLTALTRAQAARAAGVGCCLLGAQGLVAVAVAERRVYAGTAALLVATVPLWVSVLRTFAGTRPTAAGAGRLALGFAGATTVLVTDAGRPHAGGAHVGGWALLVLAAAVLWAAGTLWAATSEQPPTRPATAVQLLAGGLGLLIISAATGEQAATTISPQSAAALAYLVAVDSLAGFALYNWLLRNAPITLVSTYAYAVPVVAYVIGVVGLGEPFHPVAILGAAAIVAAIATELAAKKVDPV